MVWKTELGKKIHTLEDRAGCCMIDEIMEEPLREVGGGGGGGGVRGDQLLMWISVHLWLTKLVKTTVFQHTH